VNRHLNITTEDLRRMTMEEPTRLLEENDVFKEDSTELPVDIDTFLDKADYAGEYSDGKFLADRNNDWRKAQEEIYP